MSCCAPGSGGGIYGAPAISEQAPGNVGGASLAPTILRAPVGTRILSCEHITDGTFSFPGPLPPQAPNRATMACCSVPTTSKLCGASPAPIPPVGTQPPAVSAPPNSACVAPAGSRFSALGYVAVALVLLWLLAGAFTGRLLR